MPALPHQTNDPLLSAKPTPICRRLKQRNLDPACSLESNPSLRDENSLIAITSFTSCTRVRTTSAPISNPRNNRAIECRTKLRSPHRSRRLAPLPRPRLQPQHQRRARLRIRLLLHHHQNRRRILHRAPKPKPRIQRHIAHNLRRNIAQIHRHHSESARLNQQIRRTQRLIRVLAPHPQHLLQRHSRRARHRRIKTVARIDQRARLPLRRPRRQRRRASRSSAPNTAARKFPSSRRAAIRPPRRPATEFPSSPAQKHFDRDN